MAEMSIGILPGNEAQIRQVSFGFDGPDILLKFRPDGAGDISLAVEAGGIPGTEAERMSRLGDLLEFAMSTVREMAEQADADGD